MAHYGNHVGWGWFDNGYLSEAPKREDYPNSEQGKKDWWEASKAQQESIHRYIGIGITGLIFGGAWLSIFLIWLFVNFPVFALVTTLCFATVIVPLGSFIYSFLKDIVLYDYLAKRRCEKVKKAEREARAKAKA